MPLDPFDQSGNISGNKGYVTDSPNGVSHVERIQATSEPPATSAPDP